MWKKLNRWNITGEKYLELFSPILRFTAKQARLGDCYFVAVIDNMMSKPEFRIKLYEMFSQEEIIQYMPEDQIDKVLTGPELEKNKVLEHLKSIPPEYLAQMIENVTGKPLEEMDSLGMIKQIENFNPMEYKDALIGMQPVQKQQLMLSLCKENPELYQLFAPEEYTNIINTYKQKPHVVKALEVIEKEEMIKMLQELPNDLLSMVITQIDPDVFGDMLLKKHAGLLAEVVMM